MKTRTYVAKAIIAISNLDRYTTLPNDVLAMLLSCHNTQHTQDNNMINGLLILLNRLWDKEENPFKFVQPRDFFTRIEQLIGKQFDQ